MSIKIGDKVYTWYYGVRHVAIVVAIKGSQARLRFINESGWEVEHWRSISHLKKVDENERESLTKEEIKDVEISFKEIKNGQVKKFSDVDDFLKELAKKKPPFLEDEG